MYGRTYIFIANECICSCIIILFFVILIGRGIRRVRLFYRQKRVFTDTDTHTGFAFSFEKNFPVREHFIVDASINSLLAVEVLGVKLDDTDLDFSMVSDVGAACTHGQRHLQCQLMMKLHNMTIH